MRHAFVYSGARARAVRLHHSTSPWCPSKSHLL